jgi:hypothetical protein
MINEVETREGKILAEVDVRGTETPREVNVK